MEMMLMKASKLTDNVHSKEERGLVKSWDLA